MGSPQLAYQPLDEIDVRCIIGSRVLLRLAVDLGAGRAQPVAVGREVHPGDAGAGPAAVQVERFPCVIEEALFLHFQGDEPHANARGR